MKSCFPINFLSYKFSYSMLLVTSTLRFLHLLNSSNIYTYIFIYKAYILNIYICIWINYLSFKSIIFQTRYILSLYLPYDMIFPLSPWWLSSTYTPFLKSDSNFYSFIDSYFLIVLYCIFSILYTCNANLFFLHLFQTI